MALSFLSVEVYLVLLPLSIVLFLGILPIHAISSLAAKLVRAVEAHNFYGVTVFLAIGVFSLIAFALNVKDVNAKYALREAWKTNPTAKIEALNNRIYRLERDIYIHISLAAISLSLKKIASLYLLLDDVRNKNVKRQETSSTPAVSQKEKKD